MRRVRLDDDLPWEPRYDTAKVTIGATVRAEGPTNLDENTAAEFLQESLDAFLRATTVAVVHVNVYAQTAFRIAENVGLCGLRSKPHLPTNSRVSHCVHACAAPRRPYKILNPCTLR